MCFLFCVLLLGSIIYLLHFKHVVGKTCERKWNGSFFVSHSAERENGGGNMLHGLFEFYHLNLSVCAVFPGPAGRGGERERGPAAPPGSASEGPAGAGGTGPAESLTGGAAEPHPPADQPRNTTGGFPCEPFWKLTGETRRLTRPLVRRRSRHYSRSTRSRSRGYVSSRRSWSRPGRSCSLFRRRAGGCRRRSRLLRSSSRR